MFLRFQSICWLGVGIARVGMKFCKTAKKKKNVFQANFPHGNN